MRISHRGFSSSGESLATASWAILESLVPEFGSRSTRPRSSTARTSTRQSGAARPRKRPHRHGGMKRGVGADDHRLQRVSGSAKQARDAFYKARRRSPPLSYSVAHASNESKAPLLGSTSTAVTVASDGPLRAQLMIWSSASVGPATIASTDPSWRLRTPPRTPNRRASWTIDKR